MVGFNQTSCLKFFILKYKYHVINTNNTMALTKSFNIIRKLHDTFV